MEYKINLKVKLLNEDYCSGCPFIQLRNNGGAFCIVTGLDLIKPGYVEGRCYSISGIFERSSECPLVVESDGSSN